MWTMNNSSPLDSKEVRRNLIDSALQAGPNEVKKDRNENEVDKANQNESPLISKARQKIMSHPPPKPFKKANYPWQIKNYEFTIEKMTESIKKELDEIQMMQRHHPNAANTSQNGDHRDLSTEMCRGDTSCPLAVASSAVHSPADQQLLRDLAQLSKQNIGRNLSTCDAENRIQNAPLMNAGQHMYPGNGFNTEHVPSPGSERQSHISLEDRENSILTWHTRQLCKNIFDTTVHRMLEKISYILPDGSTAINPRYYFASDAEKITQEQADNIAIHNQALSAAIHQKYLMETEFSYDQIESASSSEYDSSEEEESEEDIEPRAYNVTSDVHMKDLTEKESANLRRPVTAKTISPSFENDEPLNLCDDSTDCDLKTPDSKRTSTSSLKRCSDSFSDTDFKKCKTESDKSDNDSLLNCTSPEAVSHDSVEVTSPSDNCEKLLPVNNSPNQFDMKKSDCLKDDCSEV